jgi:hypothetical protein
LTSHMPKYIPRCAGALFALERYSLALIDRALLHSIVWVPVLLNATVKMPKGKRPGDPAVQSATAGITKKKPTKSKSNTHALHSYDQFNSFEAHAAMCPQNTTEETTMACFNTDDDPFIITCKEAIRNPAPHGDGILLVISRERERLSQRWWVSLSQSRTRLGRFGGQP